MMMKSSSWGCHLATDVSPSSDVSTWPWSLLASVSLVFILSSLTAASACPLLSSGCCQMSRLCSPGCCCVSCHGVMIRIMISMITRMLEAAHHMNNGQDTAAEDRGWAQVTAAPAGQRADSSCHQLSQLPSSLILLSQSELHFCQTTILKYTPLQLLSPVRTWFYPERCQKLSVWWHTGLCTCV